MNTPRSTTAPHSDASKNPLIIHDGKRKSRVSILVFDGDAEHRESVKRFLQGRGHEVAAFDSKPFILISELRSKVQNADVVLFDLTVLNHEIWTRLCLISELRGSDGLPPRVGCSSGVDRGAAFELRVNRLGFRLSHAE